MANNTLILISEHTDTRPVLLHSLLEYTLKEAGFEPITGITGTEVFMGDNTIWESSFGIYLDSESPEYSAELNCLTNIAEKYKQRYIYVIDVTSMLGYRAFTLHRDCYHVCEPLQWVPKGAPIPPHAIGNPATIIPGKGYIIPALQVGRNVVVATPITEWPVAEPTPAVVPPPETLHQQRMSGDKRRSYPY